MKILFITSRFPYPIDKGDKLRVYQQLKYLSKKHDIYLFSLNRNQLSENSLKSVREFTKGIKIVNISIFSVVKNIVKAFFTDIPFQAALFYSDKAQKEFDHFVANIVPDILFYQLIRTGEFQIPPLENKIRTVFDYVDVLSKGLERRKKNANYLLKAILNIEYKRVKNYEKKMYERYDRCLIITQNDKKALPLSKRNKVNIIPNGIDDNFFNKNKFNCKKDIDLLFLGNMSYPPNIIAVKYFIDNIFPLILKKLPNTKFYIVGANPGTKMKRYERLRNVKVTGWVSDVREYYSRAKVFIAPMQIGTGLQNKILEAMSMQVPAVISSLAQQGIQASNNINILIEDDSEKFAERCVELILNNEYAETIGANARKFVIKNYSLEFIGQLLEKRIINDLHFHEHE